ncbi:MAG: cadmium-translocating P-type ATPase [Candidatus Omnitrophica bacterium]|nr:cadmium-translocating P-type ATPase [Candidatus Omnitrophota bacterium]
MKKNYDLHINGVDYNSCAQGIKKAVLKLKGVSSVDFYFETLRLTVVADETFDRALVVNEVKKMGYQVVDESKGVSTSLLIQGMDCQDEVSLIEKKIKSLSGIESFQVNLMQESLALNYDPSRISLQDIIKAINQTGLKASRLSEKKAVKESWWKTNQIIFLALCGAFLGIAFILERAGIPHQTAKFVYALSILIGGYYPAKMGIMALRTWTVNIRLLMVCGAAGAVALGFWDEAAMLVFIYSLGDVLEAYATNKARGSIRALMALIPKEAVVKRNGFEEGVPVEEIRVGDNIVIKPGEKIPLDGEVSGGSSFVDEAAITGESIPIEKSLGKEVFAGSINQRGSLEVRVTKLSKDTTLAKIIHSVEEAQARKSTYQRFGEKFGQYYTPVIFVLAIMIAVLPPLVWGQPFDHWFYRGLVLLVVSCSCGIALSVPVAVVAAVGNAARHGILIKGGACLEAASHLKIIAFDKTGTLTIGKPTVRDVVPLNNQNPEEILRIAASLESRSEHPLAEAIMREALEKGVSLSAMDAFEAIPGKGAQGRIDGQTYFVGAKRLFEESNIHLGKASDVVDRLQSEGKTTVLLGTDKEILAVLAVADQLRPEAREAVKRLKELGLRIIMLTGDNPGTARAIAHEAGIDDYRAGLLPEDKASIVKELKATGRVGFIGDGINDAPAMAEADVGISMGATGTDVAIETGDLSLMADDLLKLPHALSLSKRAVNNIKQNIFASLVIVVLLVPAGIFGLVSLVSGLLLNEVSALIVIANGLRLLKY